MCLKKESGAKNSWKLSSEELVIVKKVERKNERKIEKALQSVKIIFFFFYL
jgi:hypothetical protein